MKNIVAVGVLAAVALAVSVPSIATAQFAVDEQIRADANLADGGANGDIVGGFSEIIKFLASILAVLAVLVIVIAGILYITSGGDDGRIQTAKNWILYAVIGLIVALLAWVIVNTIGGAFGLT